MKRLLFLFCAIVFTLVGQAQESNWTDPVTHVKFYFKIIDPINKYVRIGGNDVNSGVGGTEQIAPNTTGVVTIPGTVPYNGDTYKVTELGYHTLDFTTWTFQKKIIISENIRVIHSLAIDNNVMPLEEIIFPSSLEVLENDGCHNLQSLKYIDLSNTHITSVGLFDMVGFSIGGISYIKLPQTLREITDGIVDNAMGTIHNVKDLVLPEKVNRLSINVFAKMLLREVTFQNPTPASILPNLNYPGVTCPMDASIVPTLQVAYVPIDATKAYQTTPGWSERSSLYREKVSFGATGYRSFYLENENFLVPAGCTAYIITGTTPSGNIANPDQAVVKAFTAGKIIPKKTGFILQGPASSTVAYQANVTGTEESVAGNYLVGTATEQELSGAGYKYYVLANGDQGMGFYSQGTRGGASIKLGAHHAGLRLPAAIARAKSFTVDFESARQEAEATGISTIEATKQPHTDVIYDLQGRRVVNPTHGIYIINGKKVIK